VIADVSQNQKSTDKTYKRWKLGKAIMLKNGSKYDGELLNGMKDGQGTQIWKDGSKYEG